MKKLILFLAVLLSGNIGLGAELVPRSSIKRMELRAFDPSNQPQEIKDGRNNFLKVFYEKNPDGSYSRCAFLIGEEQSKDKKIVRFTKFSKKSYKEAEGLLCARQKYGYNYLLFITDTQNNTFYANAMEHWQQPEELLEVEASYLWIGSDKVEYQFDGTPNKIEICCPQYIAQIGNALSSGVPLLVTLIEKNRSHSPFKVTKWSNGAYLHWDGWTPQFVPNCVGMSHNLTKIGDPLVVEIDLNKDKEYLPTYQRNKYVSRFLLLSICAGLAYWLKNKMGL